SLAGGVTRDGTDTANLSGLADGSVGTSLTFTDAAGNTFAASGASVTLDKDTGETATLSLPSTLIGSAGAGAVTFSITGFDAADKIGRGSCGKAGWAEGARVVRGGG